MTPSGIEPATFRFILQCLSQLCYPVLKVRLAKLCSQSGHLTETQNDSQDAAAYHDTQRISNVLLTVPYPKQERSSTMVAPYFIKAYFNIILRLKSISSKLYFLFEFSD